MVANREPVFALKPNLGGGAATAANTAGDGGGTICTNIFDVFTSWATDGSWVEKIRLMPVASVAATVMTATVCRVFVTAITSGPVTNANCFCIAEIALPAATADQTLVANNAVDVPLRMGLPAAWKILITNHAAPAANTRWQATFPGSGDFS